MQHARMDIRTDRVAGPRPAVRRKIAALLTASLVLTGSITLAAPSAAAGAAKVKQQAKKVKTSRLPAPIKSVKSKPGKKPGTAVISWKADNTFVSYFELELASTSFSKKIKTLPNKGLDYRKVKIPRTAKKFTISEKLAAKAGAPVGSGSHIIFRFAAVNAAGKKKLVRAFPYQQAVHTAPVTPAKTGIKLRFASYNVASSRATATTRPWNTRKAKVAANIVKSKADVVMLQEVGPGNEIDGTSPNGGAIPKQTESLEKAVNSIAGGSSYKLVKRNAYKAPGTLSASQGARILYNSARLAEISQCADETWWPERQRYRDYSETCTITLPILKSDTKAQERRAVYALFEDRATGTKFWAVSTHLEPRKAAKGKKAMQYDKLRQRQMKTIIKTMNSLNTENYPILLGGDINISQYNQTSGALPHRALMKSGYQDASATKKRKGVHLPTSNQWKVKAVPNSNGYGPRIDVLMTKGIIGSLRYVNTMKRVDKSRESDHALIHATVRVPGR